MKSGHHHPQHPNDWHYGNQGTDWDHHKVELKQFQSPIDLPINQLMLMEAGNKLDTEIQFSYDAVPESYYIDHRLHRSIQVIDHELYQTHFLLYSRYMSSVFNDELLLGFCEPIFFK